MIRLLSLACSYPGVIKTMLLAWKRVVFLSLIALKASSSFVSEGHLKLYGYVSVLYNSFA